MKDPLNNSLLTTGADNETLLRQSRIFFQKYGTAKLLGSEWFRQNGVAGPDLSFDALLDACNFSQNPELFFETVFSELALPVRRSVKVNGIALPYLYLVFLLEICLPGQRLHHVKTCAQLDALILQRNYGNASLEKVMEQFPVRLSDHVIRQSMVSENVAAQYLPFVDELDPEGDPITFDGHLKKGVLEQMYENRVIFLLDMKCPVYCRFCFRKHKENRKAKTPGKNEILEAVKQIEKKQAVREILITGGEPLINRPNLETALTGVKDTDHVRIIRIATRSVAYWPELFLKKDREYIRYLVDWNKILNKTGKRIEIGVHFVHPDEVSVQSLEIISTFVKNGIQVYLQTPFLNGINTRAEDLARLFTLLRNAGTQIYYIFTPCSPIHGTKSYWTTISQAFDAYRQLTDLVSDRCLPKLCTATPLGKIEWGTSGWAVSPDENNDGFTWIRTPYTPEYYRQFVEDESRMPVHRVNSEGTLDAKFQVRMGDHDLFTGRYAQGPDTEDAARLKSDEIESIRAALMENPGEIQPQCHGQAIGMCLDDPSRLPELPDENDGITEICLHVTTQAFAEFETLSGWIKKIRQTNRITYVRLNLPWLNTCPGILDANRIEGLSMIQDHSVGNPFRLEIETFFLMPQDVGTGHAKIAQMLISKGINIFSNVPLVAGLNDKPLIMKSMANQLRKAGIQFHMIITAGLPVQRQYKRPASPDMNRIIDIAAELRRSCSGRQIPLYGVQTKNGLRPLGFDLSGTAI